MNLATNPDFFFHKAARTLMRLDFPLHAIRLKTSENGNTPHHLWREFLLILLLPKNLIRKVISVAGLVLLANGMT
jgi:hypothetical protein